MRFESDSVLPLFYHDCQHQVRFHSANCLRIFHLANLYDEGQSSDIAWES